MSLNWKWDEKCGEAIFRQSIGNETKDFTKTLYEGNALLIFLSEWNEDGVDKYSLYSFWADKEHMKNCLGLNKKRGYTENIFDDGLAKLVKIRLNKKKCRNVKDIVTALVQAFDNIEIEIFSEEVIDDTENA